MLKEPIEGWVDPIDYAREGTYELTSLQEIAGRNHADALGYVKNILRRNGHEFVADRQILAIFGEDLSTPLVKNKGCGL